MQAEQVIPANALMSDKDTGVGSGKFVRWVPALSALLLLAGTTCVAHAQVWIDAGQLNGKLPDWVDPAYFKPVADQHEQVIANRHWCEPVYRTIFKRVWHEAIVRTICERTWVPARYELRDCWCDGHPGQELVLVEPGHYEMSQHQIVVSPACWETIEVRELVSAGHYEE